MPWIVTSLTMLSLFTIACTDDSYPHGDEREQALVASSGTREQAQSLIAAPGTRHTPCIPSSAEQCNDMYFVVHEDDDLLFMNPDIQNSIRQGNNVTVVHITAGDLPPSDFAPGGWYSLDDDPDDFEQYWIDRERGILNAYAYMALGSSASLSIYTPPSLLSGGDVINPQPYIPSTWQLVVDPGQSTSILIDGVLMIQYDS